MGDTIRHLVSPGGGGVRLPNLNHMGPGDLCLPSFSAIFDIMCLCVLKNVFVWLYLSFAIATKQTSAIASFFSLPTCTATTFISFLLLKLAQLALHFSSLSHC